MFDTLKTTDSGDLLQCISESLIVNTLATCGPDSFFDDDYDVYVDKGPRFEYTTRSPRNKSHKQNNNQ
jgi:hypothetical protein